MSHIQVILVLFASCNFIVLFNIRVRVVTTTLTTSEAAGPEPGEQPSQASSIPVVDSDVGEHPGELQGSGGHDSRVSPSLVQTDT